MQLRPKQDKIANKKKNLKPNQLRKNLIEKIVIIDLVRMNQTDLEEDTRKIPKKMT